MVRPELQADTIGNTKDITGKRSISDLKPLTQEQLKQIADEIEATYLEASKLDDNDFIV